MQDAPWGSAYQVLGWIILNIGHHLKFDYPDPGVGLPVFFAVDGLPQFFPHLKAISSRAEVVKTAAEIEELQRNAALSAHRIDRNAVSA
ncbi:hypothetical protein ACUOFC_15470, partial [Escherichia sp. TWPC-MK]